MAKRVQVVLNEDIKSLGNDGDLVEVAPGFARNFLLPNKKAFPVTPTVSNMVNNNLNSSNPPPEATVQYPGTDRLGNNSMLMPGVNQYTGTQLNPGPFNIQCTGNQSGGAEGPSALRYPARAQ